MARACLHSSVEEELKNISRDYCGVGWERHLHLINSRHIFHVVMKTNITRVTSLVFQSPPFGGVGRCSAGVASHWKWLAMPSF